MSRSNYDKPFYVDVGTSIVAIRCASNHDVVVEYNHELHPCAIKTLEDACDRMNEEAEIGKPPRNCDVGTVEQQRDRFFKFCLPRKCQDCPLYSEKLFSECGLNWAQMTYHEEK